MDKLFLHKHFQIAGGTVRVFLAEALLVPKSKALSPDQQINIYLDIEDTRSRLKLHKLGEVRCSDKYDFTSQYDREFTENTVP